MVFARTFVKTCDLVTLLVLLCCALSKASKETYSEEGFAAWLDHKHILLRLHFHQAAVPSRHAALFPFAIMHIARTTRLQRLHLSLARGRWHTSVWGHPLFPVDPGGATLEAQWAVGTSRATSDTHWRIATHTLSGLVCSSLGLMGGDPLTPVTVLTRDVREEVAVVAGESVPAHAGFTHLGALPREAVCTENLSPWLKLTPCRGVAGVAGLLANHTAVFGGGYHSLSTTITVTRDVAGEVVEVQLAQVVTAVIKAPPNLARSAKIGQKGKPIPLQAVLPLLGSLQPCAAAQRASLYVLQQAGLVEAAEEQEQAAADGSGGGCVLQLRGSVQGEGLGEGKSEAVPQPSAPMAIRAVDLGHQQHTTQQGASDTSNRIQGLLLPPAPDPYPSKAVQGLPVAASSYTLGSGTAHGTLVIDMQLSPGAAARMHPLAHDSGAGVSQPALCVSQLVPWYVRLWLHTLQLLVDGQVAPLSQHLAASHMQPAKDREAPLVLQLCLRFPPNTTSLSLSAHFSKAFLSLKELPPDALRGFDVPPPQIQWAIRSASGEGSSASEVKWAELGGSGSGCGGGGEEEGTMSGRPMLQQMARSRVQQVQGDGLMVQLATPDSSMPYNVICLTSTVLTVYVGATLNALVKRPGKEARVAAANAVDLARRRATKRRKLLLVLVLVVASVMLGVALDPEAQDQLKALLAG